MFSHFDSFELSSGLYFWLQHNWESQTDPLYQAFCVLTEPGMYCPSRRAEHFGNIEPGAQEVYDLLTIENYELVLSEIINYDREARDI